jgi:hypothetical protein
MNAHLAPRGKRGSLRKLDVAVDCSELAFEVQSKDTHGVCSDIRGELVESDAARDGAVVEPRATRIESACCIVSGRKVA